MTTRPGLSLEGRVPLVSNRFWWPRDGHACCSYPRISLEVDLLYPPLGLLHSLVEILGEGGKEVIGQSDYFVMV